MHFADPFDSVQLQAGIPLLEPGLQHGAGQVLQFSLEGTAGGPGREIQAEVEAHGAFLFEGPHPGLASLRRALPVDPAWRIAHPQRSSAFGAAGALLG